MVENDRYSLNKQLAQVLKGGVIMDVTSPEQARIAEGAGNTEFRIPRFHWSRVSAIPQSRTPRGSSTSSLRRNPPRVKVAAHPVASPRSIAPCGRQQRRAQGPWLQGHR